MRIPRADLIPLTRICMERGRDLLEGSLILVDAGKLTGATNEFILGAQEIGKAKLLSDAFQTGEAQPAVPGFYDHEAKVEAARAVLGSSALWLRGGAFQYGVFQADAFDVAVPANERVRLEVLYVNYGSTGLLKPPPIDPIEFRGHVVDAIAALPAIATKLIEEGKL